MVKKGEKNNKFFLSLEKSNKYKSILNLLLQKTETYQEIIAQEIKECYKSMFSSKNVDGIPKKPRVSLMKIAFPN